MKMENEKRKITKGRGKEKNNLWIGWLCGGRNWGRENSHLI